MLMLYQMKEWFINRQCEQQHVLLTTLDNLLDLMNSQSVINEQDITPFYQIIQTEMFPANKNWQQDANEFFTSLFEIMQSATCNLDQVTFSAIVETFDPIDTPDMEIRSLIFGATPIDPQKVFNFSRKWETLPPEQQNLQWWTVVNGEIVERPEKNRIRGTKDYQPAISRGDVDDFESLDFKTEATIRRTTLERYQVFNIVLPAERSDVCKLVEDVLKHGQMTSSQLISNHRPRSLFNLKTKKNETYNNFPWYLLVLMKYVPRSIAADRKFTYMDAITVNDDDSYALTCVIYRRGCGSESGHFTAALFGTSGWVYYNDRTKSRDKVQNLAELEERVPFMLLFQKLPVP
jgi:hypothetical protein